MVVLLTSDLLLSSSLSGRRRRLPRIGNRHATVVALAAIHSVHWTASSQHSGRTAVKQRLSLLTGRRRGRRRRGRGRGHVRRLVTEFSMAMMATVVPRRNPLYRSHIVMIVVRGRCAFIILRILADRGNSRSVMHFGRVLSLYNRSSYPIIRRI